MVIEFISTWLKTTVPGIILLSALGSILAGLFIWISKKYILPGILSLLKTWLEKTIYRLIRPNVKNLADVYLSDKDNALLIYYSVQIAKFIFSIFVISWSLYLSIFAFSHTEDNLFRIAVILPIIIFFLGLKWSAKIFLSLLVPHYVDIKKEIKRYQSNRRINK